MHAIQSLAQRAPPATRTRVRWQPYNPMPASSCCTRSPSTQDIHTPIPAAATPVARPHKQPESASQPLYLPTPQTSKDTSARDPSKAKFNLGLIDQAVKSLSEIWRPQDIPAAFISSSRTCIAVGPAPQTKSQLTRNISTQLPTPPSATAQPSPLSDNHHLPTILTDLTPPSEKSLPCANNLVPIKSFVHEVLRRSRTSGQVLQTALCYLEAIRAKVPELVQQEKSGLFVSEMASDDRICLATEAELARERELCMEEEKISTVEFSDNCEIMDTVRVSDDMPASSMDINSSSVNAISGAFADQTTPRLPSPLLCPRRAFLASLILASKFIQDKCYSNRAWAKLSGLPPREISRCERALGEALEWRLWVGKRPAAPSASTSQGTAVNRSLARSQSMPTVVEQLSIRPPFLAPVDRPETVSTSSSNTGLRRCATLPTEAYSLPVARPFGPCEILNMVPQLEQTIVVDTTKPTEQLSASVYMEVQTQSPSPETPGLTYSPSSTESSSGDGTIQMSASFDDGPTAPNVGSAPWAWEAPDFASCLPKTPSSTDATTKHVACPMAVPLVEFVSSLARAGLEDLRHTQAPPWALANDVQMYPVPSYA